MFIDFFLICAFFLTYRNHSLDIESSTIQDAGDYTFVPEGYTQTLSAKVHIIGTATIQKFSNAYHIYDNKLSERMPFGSTLQILPGCI